MEGVILVALAVVIVIGAVALYRSTREDPKGGGRGGRGGDRGTYTR